MQVGDHRRNSVLSSGEDTGLAFNTHYSRFPYTSIERSARHVPNINHSVLGILSKVHTLMKPVPKKEFQKAKINEPRNSRMLEPTDEEIRKIELTSERILDRMSYTQLRQYEAEKRAQAQQFNDNYDPKVYQTGTITARVRKSKGKRHRAGGKSIAQLKADLMTKAQTNKRRFDDQDDWQTYSYRQDQNMKDVANAKREMDIIVREFNRLKTNHEGLSSELKKIRNTLTDIDERLTDTVINASPLFFTKLDEKDESKVLEEAVTRAQPVPKTPKVTTAKAKATPKPKVMKKDLKVRIDDTKTKGQEGDAKKPGKNEKKLTKRKQAKSA